MEIPLDEKKMRQYFRQVEGREPTESELAGMRRGFADETARLLALEKANLSENELALALEAEIGDIANAIRRA